MDELEALLAEWPVGRAAAGVAAADGTRQILGDGRWPTRIASVTKLLVGYAGLVALEEGAIGLDEPAGPPGATVRHLLAHAAGLTFDQHRVIAEPGTRRIYSNAGIEQFAEHLAGRTGIAFPEYLRQAVLEPLGLARTTLEGSPAHQGVSTVEDLLRFARELLAPTLISRQTLVEATRVQFPALSGILPGLGRFDPNPWGLAFEVRADKDPHWTGRHNSPGTFGHFGGSGSFLWVDPEAGLACAALTDRDFDSWALKSWPRFSDEVLVRWSADPREPGAPG